MDIFDLPVLLNVRVIYPPWQQRVTDWEAVIQRTKGIFLKCPPRELLLRAPAYVKETLRAGG